MNSQITPNVAKDPTVETDRISHEPGKSHDVIAKAEFIRVSPGGERSSISAAVGSPYKTLAGIWRTPIRLRGFSEPTPEVYGEDSLQSLNFAIRRIQAEFDALTLRGEKLLDQDGNEVAVGSYLISK